jgi:hypothetical protein
VIVMESTTNGLDAGESSTADDKTDDERDK